MLRTCKSCLLYTSPRPNNTENYDKVNTDRESLRSFIKLQTTFKDQISYKYKQPKELILYSLCLDISLR